MLNNKRHGTLAAVAVMAATALAITSCGSSEPAKPAAGDGGATAAAEPVTITVHTFGGGENFGYDKAVETWNAAHPDIQVK
ncbi:hypothetical protein OG884_00500 [Streptosporangium sp. NBC_01755]|uniref:hypothetical protein n=1 Tax=unclassified Streptosporangium TaxID=2632669 RepID=UPI002DDAA25F|nr:MULTISPECIES: hypothetical protein [unclassified Streptosporangium]WSA28067.1 hypothetical protein OIE13_09465 [Streptosporangium sp. NBC_01810]WSD00460.1 hypothetical protein OG884_00500 [Streptosporangium sp. NBC_01755]